MENQHQKWVNLSFFALAALVGYLFFSLANWVVGSYDLETRVRNLEVIVRVGSMVLTGLTFLILYKHSKANQFMNEVMTELSRVTWPSQKDTGSATAIVIIMVLISGVVLGLLDYAWTRVIQWVL